MRTQLPFALLALVLFAGLFSTVADAAAAKREDVLAVLKLMDNAAHNPNVSDIQVYDDLKHGGFVRRRRHRVSLRVCCHHLRRARRRVRKHPRRMRWKGRLRLVPVSRHLRRSRHRTQPV